MDLRERNDEQTSRHPWELARKDFVIGVLRKHDQLHRAHRILDVGSGDAWVAGQLAAAIPDGGDVVAWDTNYIADDLAKLGREGVTVTATRPQGHFQLLTLLDVLEHVPDDRAFLNDLVSSFLVEDAAVMVTVPAWQQLFSRHDEALLHHRRYAPAQLRAVLASAGLDVVVAGGFFHGLLAPRAASLAMEKLARPRGPATTEGLGGWRGGPLLTKAIVGALSLEASVSLALAERGVDLPGLSYFALCRRRR